MKTIEYVIEARQPGAARYRRNLTRMTNLDAAMEAAEQMSEMKPYPYARVRVVEMTRGVLKIFDGAAEASGG